VQTLRSAAALLAAATTLPALAAIAAEIGFRGPPLPLDADALAPLGLGAEPHVRAAHIIPGTDALRALIIECDPGAPLRDAVAAIARRLTARAPHLLWLLLAVQRDATALAIAAWTPTPHHPHVAALVVDRAHVLPSDAETLVALSAAKHHDDPGSDLRTHASWLDVLGRQALTRRFYRTLEHVVAALARAALGSATDDERNELALLYVSRLLFLSFLETKGWLDGDRRFLERGFARAMERGGGYHRHVLRPLFFGTLNTPLRARAPAARAFGRVPFLNGGLFARTPLERRRRDLRFPDDALGLVFGDLLARYRFTPREEHDAWSEAAIDPEMLGKAFESLMRSHERRASGSFYTPQSLVTTTTHAALVQALATPALPPPVLDAALRDTAEAPLDPDIAPQFRAQLEALRLVDPACGSGAFLVHALEAIAALRIRAGDARPVAAVRRDVLTGSIFGVDVNPMAVWLCELRLWLSMVIESDEHDPLAVTPLPNLDRHIRVGDSLAGEAFDASQPPRGGALLARLRARYARATGSRKHTLERAIDRAERSLALAHTDDALARCAARRRDLLATLRGRDLFGARIRPRAADRIALARERSRARELRTRRRALRSGGALPFAWLTHFPDVARAGGFDVVIGNPPWVRLHRIPPAARATLRERFEVFRDASWERGATAGRAGAGFAAQVDMAALFAERSLALLRPGGTLALLLPAKLWRSLAGGGVRRLLASRAHVLALEDWSESPPAFDAAVYPSLVVARRSDGETTAEPRASTAAVAAACHRPNGVVRWTMERTHLPLDADPASPWLAVPPPVRSAFDRLARAGAPLAACAFGPPTLGVKCGCNDAFIVRVCDDDTMVAAVHAAARTGTVERALLRPLVRGETSGPWRSRGESTESIIWTHDDTGAPLRTLPPHAARWLAPWRKRLADRSDVRRATPWWSLFRITAAQSDRPRVVWADVGRAPRAMVLAPGDPTVPLNSCYVLHCRDLLDAHALAALLNSPVGAAWLHVLAEPARGGYRRFLAWTVALLPIPHDWSRARAILAPLGERAAMGDLPPPAPDALRDAALRAYRVRLAHVAPLLAWTGR
jgi:hypothetical protein